MKRSTQSQRPGKTREQREADEREDRRPAWLREGRIIGVTITPVACNARVKSVERQ